MINIVTKNSDNYKYFFNDCESFFKAIVHSKDFNNSDINTIASIDNAVLLDKVTGTVKTPFGVCSIEELSTGCKIVLVYLYILRNRLKYNGSILLDVTECGSNALDVLFELDNSIDSNITFLLRHHNNLFKCKSRDYLIDGKHKKRLF